MSTSTTNPLAHLLKRLLHAPLLAARDGAVVLRVAASAVGGVDRVPIVHGGRAEQEER
jgi:hypothetical protein